MLLTHTNKITEFLTQGPQQHRHHGADILAPERCGALVIVWSLFCWRAPKHYYTVMMHGVCVRVCVCNIHCVFECVCVCVSMSGFVSLRLSRPLHGSLYMQSRTFSLTALDFDLRLTPTPLPPNPFCGHDTRSSVCWEKVMCSVCVCVCMSSTVCNARVSVCMDGCVPPPLACLWELWQRERRAQNMISSITQGVGG